ncbi:CHAT domain-containing protein [Agromyces sp. Leaf222]|uniref:CHAT domain-containing protein n=1 Tax=Agromyces sp. Leaf222 TaxID=1735688 RepID=UPI00138F7024|nr:CHAT domain-containing protein [Agromyces sp. Leaf222]
MSLIDGDSWLRVEVRTDGDLREMLALAAEWAATDELANVLELADTIAIAFDFDSVGSEHIALALVASARLDSAQREELLDVVAEAFGFGTMEGIGSAVEAHLRRQESTDPTSEDTARLRLTLADPWWTITRIAPFVHPSLRIALCVVLVVLAVRGGSIAAWFIALAAAVPFRDPKLMDWPDFPRYPRGILAGIPSLLVLSGTAAAFGLLAMAIVLLTAHVLFEGIGILLDRIPYRHLQTAGSALNGLEDYRGLIGRALGQIYRGSYRNRLLRWFLPLIPVGYIAFRWHDVLFIPVLRQVEQRLPAELIAREPQRVISEVFEQAALAGVVLGVLLMLGASGHLLIALAMAIVAIAVRGWPPLIAAIVLLLGMAIHLYDWWAWRRIPSARFPVPVFLPRRRPLSGLVAQFRVRRSLRLGRPVAALREYEHWLALSTPESASPSREEMVHAHLLLEAGRPGEAWDLRDLFPKRAEVFQGYIVARTMFLLNRLDDAHNAALEVGSRMQQSPMRVPKALRVVVALTITEILSHATPEVGVGLTVLARLPDLADGGRVHEPVRMLRSAAVTFEADRPELAERCAHAAAGLAILAQNERATSRERNRESTLMAQQAMATCQATRYMFGNGEATVSSWSLWRTGVEILFRDGNPVEVGYELRAMIALLDAAPGFERAAYRLRLDLLGVLNTIRHELRTREDRHAWWQTFHPALDDAIGAAFAGKDWSTLAELIEYGRLQSEAATGPIDAARKPLFIRANGRSVLQNGFWEQPGAPAPAYDLEAAAAVVAGPGAWWWSTWEAQGQLYWALVRPGMPATGGRVPMSELAGPLARMHDALPIEFPGENASQRDRRLADSPFVNGPIRREHELSRDLAALVPEPLQRAILESAATVSLAISPDVALSHVPWAGIILGPADVRLIEHVRITIAPPVAALVEIIRRADPTAGADSGPLPIRLAVLDPGGDLAGAAGLAEEVPNDATVLTAADTPTAVQVVDALQRLARGTTWLFAGHTTRMPPEGRAALSFTATGRYDPSFVISGDALPTLPRSVILLACDSGDLRSVSAGEWNTLGPAMLRSGADRVVATAFPIKDVTAMDRAIIARAADLPIGEALHQAQLLQLETWRSTRGRLSPPADWAGHLVIGANYTAQQLPRRFGPSQVWVASAAFDLLDAAAGAAARAGRPMVQMRDIWIAVLEWGWETIGRPADLLLRAAARAERLRAGSAATVAVVGIAPDVMALLQDAVELSRALHHRIVLDDHIIASCFARKGGMAAFARLVTGLDSRSLDGAAFMTERHEAGWNRTGIPALTSLPDAAARELCGIAGTEQFAEERWYNADR